MDLRAAEIGLAPWETPEMAAVFPLRWGVSLTMLKVGA